ncbi:MAG: glycosyltransferase [Phycisphaerae bacterium]|nr:glycosyltransferase [Phycisphaerae bacterium]
MKPRVSILVPSISSNILWAGTVLAQCAEPDFESEVIGPDLGEGVSPSCRGIYPYKVVSTPRLYRIPDFFRETHKLEDAISGDVVIAVKAFADTVPVALRERKLHGRKVVVYLDEWDAAVFRQMTARERVRMCAAHWHHPMQPLYFPLVERMIHRADAVISTTTFLQKKFGGQVLHLGVDCDVFKPRPPDETARMKSSLGLESLKLIVFGGVVHKHKGLEVVLDALARIKRSDLRLVVVGPITDHLRSLQAQAEYGPYLVAAGPQPRASMPVYLDMADLIVLPQNDSLLAQSQMPCKIFEAMAMAKPIIASAVSDIPEVLDGCGWTVPPGDSGALARTIEHVLGEPDTARARGGAAREKCGRFYSREATARELKAILTRVLMGSWTQRDSSMPQVD